MDTALQEIFKPSQTIDGVDYFLGEPVIYLAAALSDYGRDYEIELQLKGVEYPTSMKLGYAIESLQAGNWEPDTALLERYLAIKDRFPTLPFETIDGFGSFTYRDPRDKDKFTLRAFDPIGIYDDLPGEFLGRLAGAHYSTMRRLIQQGFAEGGFIGEVGQKLNGLDLRYFDRQYVASSGSTYGRDMSFYLYFFYTEDNNLIAWKTGVQAVFARDALYTLIGGTVKTHDSYRNLPPKTMLTRAKFFDHSTGEKFAG